MEKMVPQFKRLFAKTISNTLVIIGLYNETKIINKIINQYRLQCIVGLHSFVFMLLCWSYNRTNVLTCNLNKKLKKKDIEVWRISHFVFAFFEKLKKEEKRFFTAFLRHSNHRI